MSLNVILVTASFLSHASDTNAGDNLLTHISSVKDLCEKVGALTEAEQVEWIARYWCSQLNASDLNGDYILEMTSKGIVTIESYIAYMGKALVEIVSNYPIPDAGISLPK